MPYSSGQTSLLDQITRVYRNGAGDIIATQVISVKVQNISTVNGAGMALVTSASQSTDRFKRTATTKLTTTRSPKTGASAVIATVTTTGKFTSRTENGGDITSVTYAGTDHVNDLIIPVTQMAGVFVVGGSV